MDQAMHPYIALGTHRGYRYRLVPCLEELTAPRDLVD
jgi:hypothetical protein